MEAIIDKAKILLDITDTSKDEILDILYEVVCEEIIEFTGVASIDSISHSLKLKMLVFKYNKRGTETISSYNYSGISETLIIDYTPDILKSLDTYKRKLKVY